MSAPNYLTLGPNIIGVVDVHPPAGDGELLVATSETDAFWGTNVGLGVYASAGDLTGSSTSQTVVGLMNNSLPALSDGYLFWDGHQWLFRTIPPFPTSLPPDGPAGGDLTGTYPNPTLIDFGTLGTFGGDGLTTLQITTDGYGRISSVVPIPIIYPAPITSLPVGGQLTGTTDNAGLVGLGTAGTFGDGYNSLTVVSDGYGRLSSITAVPIEFPTELVVGGDISGTTANATVAAIQTNPVSLTAATPGQVLLQNSTASGSLWSGLSGDVQLSATDVGKATVVGLDDWSLNIPNLDSSEDGYVLTYVHADGYLEMMPPTGGGGGGGSFTAGGDLSGTSTSQTVTGLQNYPLPVPQSAWYDGNTKYYTWVPQQSFPPPWVQPQPDPLPPAGSWQLVNIPDIPTVINGYAVTNYNNGGNYTFVVDNSFSTAGFYNFNVIIGSLNPGSYNITLDTASFAESDPYGEVYNNNFIVNFFDSNGKAGSVPINITANTPTYMNNQGLTTTISGNSSYVINQNYGSVSLALSNGGNGTFGNSTWNWIVLSHT